VLKASLRENPRESASKKDPLNPRMKAAPVKKGYMNMAKLPTDNECIKKSYIGDTKTPRNEI
jgi:hypothetical protein